MNLERLAELREEAIDFYNSDPSTTVEDALDHVIYSVLWESSTKNTENKEID